MFLQRNYRKDSQISRTCKTLTRFLLYRHFSEGAWQSTKEAPTESTKSKGSKTWVIVVAVLAAFVVIGMIIFVALYKKWRRGPLTSGYKKQENDTITLENSVDL